MEIINDLINGYGSNPIVKAVFLWIMADTVFGVLRAFKSHKFNSCFGIDGGIRKVGMILSIIFLSLIKVVLPAPFLPRSPTILPESIHISASLRTSTSLAFQCQFG